MQNSSIVIIPLIIVFVCTSNFFNVLFSSVVANSLVDGNLTISGIELTSNLEPIFKPKIAKLLTNDVGLTVGFILGFIAFYRKIDVVDKAVLAIYKYTNLILRKLFIPILPLFIFGFITKAIHDGIFSILMENIKFFYIMIGLWITYIGTLYLVVSRFNISRLFVILKNVSLPFITGFTTMSSAAALPFSLKAAEENTKDHKISQFFMSATVNIHMLGDALCIPVLAMLVMKLFNVTYDMHSMFTFAIMFMITKFSGAGVPGGTILIMCPVLERVFGFTPEMVGLITTIYILIDPMTTAGSVLGNNAFVIIFQKLANYVNQLKLFNKPTTQEEVEVFNT